MAMAVLILVPHGMAVLILVPHGMAGIDVYGGTLDGNFRAPLVREFSLLCGLRSAGRTSLINLLTG